MTAKELINNPEYYKHHTSLCQGYVSTKCDGKVKEYEGRFGTGYILLTHNPQSKSYCFITYYIKK